MDESRAWLSQAASDFKLGDRAMGLGSDAALCHVVAKFQQAVEKSIKGLVVGLSAAHILSVRVGRRHEVEPYVIALIGLPRTGKRTAIRSTIQRLFNAEVRAEIRAIDSLAPKWPAPGAAPTRNTEYPYRDAGENWHAPAESGQFNRDEVDRFRRLAWRMVEGCARILSAVQRSPR